MKGFKKSSFCEGFLSKCQILGDFFESAWLFSTISSLGDAFTWVSVDRLSAYSSSKFNFLSLSKFNGGKISFIFNFNWKSSHSIDVMSLHFKATCFNTDSWEYSILRSAQITCLFLFLTGLLATYHALLFISICSYFIFNASTSSGAVSCLINLFTSLAEKPVPVFFIN